MKKLTAMLLMMVMVLSLTACIGEQSVETGNSTTEPATTATSVAVEATGFRVGYGKVDITPQESVPLQGFGNVRQRMSTGYLDKLYTTCVAISDEQDNTVLLFGQDLTTTPADVFNDIREAVSDATGVPVDRVMISASHTHSAPSTEATSVGSVARYNESLKEWLVQAAVQAMEDRKGAQMYIGSVEIQGQSFIRHYVLQDGTSVGYDSMARGKDPAGHAGIGDYTMQLLKFTREGGKDVLLVNWQAHPTRTGSSTSYDVSADIVGVIRSELETALDCYCAYFQGAAGNMNAISLVESEKVAEDYRQQGKEIAGQVIVAAENLFTQVKTGEVKNKQFLLAANVDHSQDHLLVYATQVQKVWNSTNNRSKTDAAGAPYGIRSPYHANKIVNNSKRGDTLKLELNAIAIGDVAFVTSPNELFAGVGIQIKEFSAYEMTFVLGYANDSRGYMPSEDAFGYLGYETDITVFEKGTAELVGKTLTDLLAQLYG